MELFIMIAQIIGTIAFTISGSMIAIERKMDLLGVIILGSVTAVGGGFCRDIILGIGYPTMFNDPLYCIVAVITAVLVFGICYKFKDISYIDKKWYLRGINITDSIGLGIFVVVGVQVTAKVSSNSFLIIFCAVLTGVGGGIIRDIFACKIPAVFRKHIYAIAALIGACFYYLLDCLNIYEWINIILSVIVVVVIRYLAYHFRLNLPKIELIEHTDRK